MIKQQKIFIIAFIILAVGVVSLVAYNSWATRKEVDQLSSSEGSTVGGGDEQVRNVFEEEAGGLSGKEAVNTQESQGESVQSITNQEGGEVTEKEGTDGEEIDSLDWRSYVNRTGFSVKYPRGWEIEEEYNVRLISEGGPLGDRVTIAAPEGSESVSSGKVILLIYRIDTSQKNDYGFSYFGSAKELKDYHDYAHAGDPGFVDRTSKTRINDIEFLKLQEGDFSFSYVTLRGDSYYEIRYLNPRNNLLYYLEEIARSFRFVH